MFESIESERRKGFDWLMKVLHQMAGDATLVDILLLLMISPYLITFVSTLLHCSCAQ